MTPTTETDTAAGLDPREANTGRALPWPWPDLDWDEGVRLTTTAVLDELYERGRLTLADDLFVAARARVLPFLSSLQPAKADWLDGNLRYLVAGACRGLLRAGRVVRAVFAYKWGTCDVLGRRVAPDHPEAGFYYGLTSALAVAGGELRLEPPTDWERHHVVPVPSPWAAAPLASTFRRSTWVPNAEYGEPPLDYPTPFGLLDSPLATDGRDLPWHPDPELFERHPPYLPLTTDPAQAEGHRFMRERALRQDRERAEKVRRWKATRAEHDRRAVRR